MTMSTMMIDGTPLGIESKNDFILLLFSSFSICKGKQFFWSIWLFTQKK
jgi:hypothetical protein